MPVDFRGQAGLGEAGAENLEQGVDCHLGFRNVNMAAAVNLGEDRTRLWTPQLKPGPQSYRPPVIQGAILR
jgi:hypothetical protein